MWLSECSATGTTHAQNLKYNIKINLKEKVAFQIRAMRNIIFDMAKL